MNWKRRVYWLHRWLGLLVGVQLLAWSVSGFTFTILDIDNVHGDFERRTDPPPPVRAERALLSPADALARARATNEATEPVVRITLRERFGRTVYEIFDVASEPVVAVDAATGEVIARISKEQAEAAAFADFAPDARITSIKLLEGDAPLEFRGGPMPVYQVILDHPKQTHLYISPITGKVLKRRNKPWRIFDFFWMLHIMDYGQRESFNHWLLTAMSALAILTSTTGLALWVYRIPSRRSSTATSR